MTAGGIGGTHGGTAVARRRRDFPVFDAPRSGPPLVYLDSAATTQKPQQVIDALAGWYATANANIHRGVYSLSAEATAAYDAVRTKAAAFFDADPLGVVFVRGTTEAINLVAGSWGRANLTPGDEILLTELEHHSNIIPWQLVAGTTGAVVRAVPVRDNGDLDLDAYQRLLSPRTRLVGIAHVSNALGTVNPIREMADLAHEAGALVLVDGAQSAPHLPVSVADLGADFYVCSGHKMYAPMGSGVLVARPDLLAAMPPWQGGGGMIATVSFEGSTWAPAPQRFEAGTPDVAGVIGFGAAIDYLEDIGRAAIAAHEHDVVSYAADAIAAVPGVELIGRPRERAAVVSFVMDGVHPHDIGTVLDAEGVAIRAGHHCAQPLMARMGVAATARASFGIYSDRGDVDALVAGLERVRRIFG